MSSKMTRLIRRVERLDPELAAALEAQHRAALTNIPFGLHFERHLPESIELTGLQVRVGSKVHVLPERGYLPKKNAVAAENSRRFRLWVVQSTSKRGKKTLARIESPRPRLSADDEDVLDEMLVPIEDLVAVAEFQDEIYPGLRSNGKVEQGGDKPFHAVINAENFHALEALTYCCEGQVDCVYIDPPYNTGAKDWKYCNDYVDKEDVYRHSKWLSFMEKRLVLARRLLNPADSVLIVTIDEKEVHRLALLIERLFPGSKIQMVTFVTNQRGVARGQEFARVEEYAFCVFLGACKVAQGPDDKLTSEATTAKQRIDIWNRLMRRGTDSQREDSPKQFYPIFIDPREKRIVSVGETVPLGVDRESVAVPEGLVAVWPIRTDESEGRWTLGNATLRSRVKVGMAKVGAYNKRRDRWSISYLISKDIKRIESGEIRVVGKDSNEVLILELATEVARNKLPRTVWFRDEHNAGTYGSGLLSRFVPGRKFPFPKSLYVVEDTLRVFVQDKPNALVVDFFAGSGTTAHALMCLNKQDGGRRRSISITNNEVSVAEQKMLIKKRLRPGDAEWEKRGICEYITRPRIEAAITGTTPLGKPVKGDYKFTDEFPMSEGFEENVEFLTLTYENRRSVAHKMAFKSVAPLLWLRAGSEGPRIDEFEGFAVTGVYGILEDLNLQREFTDEVHSKGARMAFVVTDDDRAFQTVCADLPEEVIKVRLYESYLTNFPINTKV